MRIIIHAAVRLHSEAAVWRGSGKNVLMMRKALKNSSREVHFVVRVQLTGLHC